MNKNNLKRILVFLATMAVSQPRLSAKDFKPVVAYDGPEFFERKAEKNEEKKMKIILLRLTIKNFIKIPKLWCRLLLGVPLF